MLRQLPAAKGQAESVRRVLHFENRLLLKLLSRILLPLRLGVVGPLLVLMLVWLWLLLLLYFLLHSATSRQLMIWGTAQNIADQTRPALGGG